MSVFKVVVTESAERDYREILEYLAEVVRNPQAVENLKAQVRRSFEVLTENPLGFVGCVDGRLASMGYRKCALRDYLFIYRVDEDAETVYVIRFFHHLQDYISKL